MRLAITRRTAAWNALRAGDVAGALQEARQAADLVPVEHSRSLLGAQVAHVLAIAYALANDAPAARTAALAGLDAIDELRRWPGVQTMVSAHAIAALALIEDWQRCLAYLPEHLDLLRRLGSWRWVGEALEFTALVLEGSGRPDRARAVFRDAAAVRVRAGEPFGGIVPAIAERIAACAARLDLDASSGPPPDLDLLLRDAAEAVQLTAAQHRSGR